MKLFCIASALAAIACSHAQTYNVTVDATLNRKSINPLIYGVAFATSAQLKDLNATVNRMGGNNQSRYNWELNGDNRDNDWFFESIADADATPAYRVDSFIQGDKAANAQTLFTVPMIPWIAKFGPDRSMLWSFSVDKYGPQTEADPGHTDAGNGVSTADGYPFITGNDPNDANTPNSVDFETGLFNHLVDKWGTAAKGGLKYYEMDNEASIWYSTHRDVNPVGVKMADMLKYIEDYATAVKAVDPTALVCGPEEWGWGAYLYSGYDQQYAAAHNYSSYPDREAHGNMDYVAWLLQQLSAFSTAQKRRMLDVFSLHYYPQDGSFGGSNPNSAAQQALRNAAPRSLWDPTYTDPSWINSKIDLIPRMQSWVNTYFPGTQTAITEYNFGDEPYINGATTQADVDGIFGLYGLDMATMWTTPDPSTPTYKVMKMYRNYDGQYHGFGDVSVSDTGGVPDDFTSYASTRTADGYLTIMLINKVATAATVNLNVKDFKGDGAIEVYQLTSANAIERQPDLVVKSYPFAVSLPGQSVTLLTLPPVGVKIPLPSMPAGLVGHPLNDEVFLQWDAAANASDYLVLRSTSPTTGFTQVGTGIGTSFAAHGLTNGTHYYFKIEGWDAAGAGPASTVLEVTPEMPSTDPAQYNFEGSAQGWTTSGGFISSVQDSFNEHYLGVYGLAVNCTATGTPDEQMAEIMSPPVKPGQTVTFHVWLPVGCQLPSIQPFVLQNGAGNWTWTGSWVATTSLTLGSWNTITVTVPSNASPLYSMGVQFNAGNTAWKGTCYVDSVSYK